MDHLQAVNTLAAERYLLDEMTDAERDEFEGHFFSYAQLHLQPEASAFLFQVAH